jgi:hypothetical protein
MFAYWLIVYYIAQLFEKKEAAHIIGHFFHGQVHALIYTLNALGKFWGDFFSQTRLVTLNFKRSLMKFTH